MITQSRAHLTDAGETYGQHLGFAATVAAMAMAAGIACIIHGLVPALCQRTASRTIDLLAQLFNRRELLAETRSRSLEAIAFVGLILMSSAVSLLLVSSTTPIAFKILYSLLAFAIPVTLLLTNRELDCPVT